MPSFNVVNYSLRPSKSIQRQLVFEGISKLKASLDFERQVYIGFGSIWFTDFVLAHRLLGIDDMISIEANEVGYHRAVFNAPYATVRVLHGLSNEVLPTLYSDGSICTRPWLVWLDYDYHFDETRKEDIISIIENSPPNSILLVTFNGGEMKYGKAPDRPARLRELFGAAVPDDLATNSCRDERMQQTLADFALDLIQSTASDLARPGGFIPAFRLIYQDNAPMVTVGGILPTKGAVTTAGGIVNNANWKCRPAKPIVAPPLTLRESAVLQSCLPSVERLSRDAVRALGFDLEEDQIETFQTYYRHCPTFVQILA
ncbi:hypothetical protein NFI95_03095 [Acetobacteraceae bacterium KSS8]|uniref:Uncharacterized protein n=1 Tax=Endosaccharibacter trunci TaxID=2812733 RepID=A0ABT1W3I0_9PROT|nr:hypothetical protein [Acetobacteraceae bacterium KSS8]